MAMRVAFIGLGLMGKPMARNILKAGFPLTVWNRTPGKAEDLLREGARWAASPAEAAREADVTITCVVDSPDVEEVVLGPQGVIHGARPGSIVVDMSTIAPKVARAIAQRLGERGVLMLDAPVSGGVWGAINGTLSIMVGGEKEVMERAMPVLRAMGQRITYCGGSGMGQVAKAVNQIIVAGTLAAVCEGLVFAARAGADLQAVFQAITGGAAHSWQLENLGPRILRGDFAPGFKVRLQQKDLRIILETAREWHLPLFTTPLVHQLFQVLERQGCGEEGTQAYIKALEQMAGVQARLPHTP
jgi:2-hydroxy-3-oxopropionate reductase